MLSGSAQSYVEVSVEVPRNLCDAVCNFIIENICSGLVLEEEDDSEVTEIKFYLLESRRNDFDQKLSTYFSSLLSLGQSLTTIPEISEKPVKSAEWEKQYRESVKPLLIAGDVSIRPPWETVRAGARYDIIIEPKMAFGTGNHESTRACLEIIRECLKPGMRFLDVGCGSGILAILADKMGASYIKAVDYDIPSIENCGENFIINNVKSPHEIVHGSIDACRDDEPYDFLCANIIKSTILDMLEDFDHLTSRAGLIVLAGLLEQDESEVSERLMTLNLDNFNVRENHEWRAFVVRKR